MVRQIADDARKHMFGDGTGRAEAQARLAPFSQLLHFFGRRLKRVERVANGKQQLIASLVQHHSFPDPFEQPAAQVGFQCAEAVADGGGC